ncbi:hypothetical protein DY000_02028762 [Brassica cretica]|uniref:Uncharacterized protein n=1 Tax=Brassica cretica TaxID=69181 RepID=A0ABQ7DR34_BRACR|nr:hypothetical protein DY000_02028762 [Brassica cretica]
MLWEEEAFERLKKRIEGWLAEQVETGSDAPVDTLGKSKSVPKIKRLQAINKVGPWFCIMVLYFSKPLNHRRSFNRNQLGKELTGLHCQSTSDRAGSSNLLLDNRLNLPSHPSCLLTSPQTISISVVMAIIQLNLKIMFTSLFTKHLRFKAFVHQIILVTGLRFVPLSINDLSSLSSSPSSMVFSLSFTAFILLLSSVVACAALVSDDFLSSGKSQASSDRREEFDIVLCKRY